MYSRLTTALSLALMASTATIAVQGVAQAAETYDCVIEPFLVVKVGSPIEGVMAEVLIKRGAPVKKGQILGRLESSVEEQTLRMAEANAKSIVEVEIAKSRVEMLAKEVERKTILVSKDWNAKIVLETAASDLQQAELQLQGARQRLNLSRLDRDRARAQLDRRIIRSPLDGVILRRLIGPGEYIHSQAAIAQLAVIEPLVVDVFLPSELYTSLSVGQVVTVRPAAPIGGTYDAKITVIDQVFDAASDTFGVRLELPNIDQELPAGVDCTLELNLG